jgi:hypothetical protein
MSDWLRLWWPVRDWFHLWWPVVLACALAALAAVAVVADG